MFLQSKLEVLQDQVSQVEWMFYFEHPFKTGLEASNDLMNNAFFQNLRKFSKFCEIGLKTALSQNQTNIIGMQYLHQGSHKKVSRELQVTAINPKLDFFKKNLKSKPKNTFLMDLNAFLKHNDVINKKNTSFYPIHEFDGFMQVNDL